jgi:hypothetical protein
MGRRKSYQAKIPADKHKIKSIVIKIGNCPAIPKISVNILAA